MLEYSELLNEKKFINELRIGKRHAFEKLIEDYQDRVFNKCLSFVPNKEDAEDIAQEVFVEVFNSNNKFKGTSKLSTWIYIITTNKCLEFIRKKNTKKRFAFLQSITGNETPIDKTSYFTEFKHPGVLLENQERSKMLFLAINKLPEDQQIAFTLHKIDGLSYKEVSEITKKSIASIESSLFRAKKNLQKLLYDFYKNDFE